MKIAFQGWFLKEPYTGIGQHCLGLLNEFATVKNLELIIAVPQKTAIAGISPKFFHVIPPKKLLHPAFARWYWEHVQVPKFFASQKATEYYPYPCPLPKKSTNKRLMTVHDLILLKDPRYRGNSLKFLYHQKAFESLKYVDQIFTVSENVKKELGIPSAKVLYNGIPKIPSKLPKPNYKNYIVYLGGYEIRKNVPALIEAFKYVPPYFKLILIGQPTHNSKYYPKFHTDHRVIQMGNISDAEVYSLLKNAYAFVHFSDSEGFNIPLVQAMASGTPCIINDTSVNREISQNAALFIDISKKEDLAAKIKMLNSPKVRKSLIPRAKKIAKNYSWKKTALKILKEINEKN